MELIPLGPGFGVEVRGAAVADIAKDAALYARLRAAFEEQSLLVFRDQQITDEIQLAYSRRFGPLEITKIGTVGAGTNLVHLTNLDAEGRVVPGDHKQALTAKANQLWHTDSSFKQVPALASVLSARIVPPSGGETEYASTRNAWDRLPVDRKAALVDLIVHHSYEHSRGKIASHLMSGAEKKALPPARWRLTWQNAVNGRRSLYLASHAFAIDDMPEAEAQRLLAGLIDEATRPGSTYLHRWRPGDVVMWDNRAMVHRGQAWPLDKPRYMVRTTISATDSDGLASVRPAAWRGGSATGRGRSRASSVTPRDE